MSNTQRQLSILRNIMRKQTINWTQGNYNTVQNLIVYRYEFNQNKLFHKNLGQNNKRLVNNANKRLANFDMLTGPSPNRNNANTRKKATKILKKSGIMHSPALYGFVYHASR